MKDMAGGRRLEKSVTVIATHRRSPLRSLPSEDHHGASRSCQAARHSAKCLPGVARVLERTLDMREMLECCSSVGSLRR